MNCLTMVPLPQQERSVDTYFSIAINGETVNDKRRYEWLRLRSFLTFPLTSSCTVLFDLFDLDFTVLEKTKVGLFLPVKYVTLGRQDPV